MSSPERDSRSWAVRWLPLRQRVTATVYLAVLLAALVGVGATWMAQMARMQTDALIQLADAANAVRGFRTNVAGMQFAAHRFVASNHTSAANQVTLTYTETRDSLTDCLVRECAGAGAQERLEQLLEHLDRFYQAFAEAVAQRSALKTVIENRFKPNLALVRSELPAIQDQVIEDAEVAETRALERHLHGVEEATNALLYTADLKPYASLTAEFECEREHLKRLSASVSPLTLSAIETALREMETTWATLLQRARSYLFLVNVVMAADAHEMREMADALEEQLDASLAEAHTEIDHALGWFTVALILLLVLGSLVVLVVGRTMARSVTAPIQALTRTFNELTAGSRAPVRLYSPHHDEIGELGRAAMRFRDANAEIHDLLRRYQALNEDLESKVAERTHALEESNRELERLAYTDRLTGVLNRRALERLIADEVKRGHRYARPLSLLFFDLDHFKVINDRYGHEVGDSVLTRLAAEVGPMLRENDRLGRWGGEEFLILCSETGCEDALCLAERIRRHVEQFDFATAGRLTLSIGIACLGKGQTAHELIAGADQAMYRAKRSGRNCTILAPLPDASRAAADDPGPRGRA
ncbi:GGDEF domain-containing protein [Halochromatium glycolicum]|uniref:GGDEF domain-containing protein n=1 Tax=Halochromatium glycolicum TaxID=85075 RepID=UPI00190A8B2E|nr:GGDEF domain-containing protein [Halochromatium glycolicum]